MGETLCADRSPNARFGAKGGLCIEGIFDHFTGLFGWHLGVYAGPFSFPYSERHLSPVWALLGMILNEDLRNPFKIV